MPAPYTIVYQHEQGEGALYQVAMASNHDIHTRMTDGIGWVVTHTMTMADFDQLVEKVHEFHAEVEDAR